MQLQQRRHRITLCAPAFPILPVTVSALFLLFLGGCGQTGAPLPPSLQLPLPVADLTASRVADRVSLHWTMPRRTTDKLPLKGPQPVHICRRVGDGPCTGVADLSFAPEKPASYDDTLPPDLAAGALRPLVYSIEIRNRHGRSAGGSILAYTAAGTAPPPFANAAGEIHADGVVLRWEPTVLSGDGNKVNIRRTLLSLPPAEQSEDRPKSPLGEGKPPLIREQTLTVRLPLGADPGKALDPDAAFDQRYSYRLSRVAEATVSGKSVEIEGPPSAEIIVDTKDTFPPQPPSGLAAVAAPNDAAIDLSWSPNAESDLAGYAVYRSTAGGQPERISPSAPVPTSNFRDLTAQPGWQYSYSVTAIDRDGNESARSTTTTELLPPKQ